MEELQHLQKEPRIHQSVYVAESAEIMGNVSIGAGSSVFPTCVLRGDINAIVVGERTNVQDGVIVHVSSEKPAVIGNDVTCGHRAIVHACVIGDEVLIGMGAIVMDGAEIGARSIIAAGAVVLPGTKVPPGSLVAGCPAEIKRSLAEEQQKGIRHWAEKYQKVSAAHQAIQDGNS